MPEYPHGTPSWVQLSTPDPEASAKFYGDLFGWATESAGGREQNRGYWIFTDGGKPVGGLMPTMQAGQPTAWATYISIDDLDTTAASIASAGGHVTDEPCDVMDLGRMAFFADPGGAVFGAWQAKDFAGAEMTNKPVSLCWNELLTRDKPAALRFYPQAFGWRASSPDYDPDGQYTIWERPDGAAVAGMMAMGPMFPPEITAYWSVCFAVADTDAVATTAVALGAKVPLSPTDRPIGRFAGFIDPFGAAFTVMELKTSSRPPRQAAWDEDLSHIAPRRGQA